ncbi:MAG: hypothetical protein Ct9H90mP27_1350 [Gammaproteobacteria bacterium]|nr:MAG: hypothetical protein Ct9H90mP27_1350 [Gammaproteobacteria bacterium]
MEIGAVPFPHNEIGTDPQAIKDYAQGVEELGVTTSHLRSCARGRPRRAPAD